MIACCADSSFFLLSLSSRSFLPLTSSLYRLVSSSYLSTFSFSRCNWAALVSATLSASSTATFSFVNPCFYVSISLCNVSIFAFSSCSAATIFTESPLLLFFLSTGRTSCCYLCPSSSCFVAVSTSFSLRSDSTKVSACLN